MSDKPLKIYTFGRFAVQINNKNLIASNTRLSKRWKLFKYLFTHCGTAVSRERLIRILNLERNDDPQASLTALVYRLRKLLRKSIGPNDSIPYIITQGEAYTFNKKSDYWLDAEAFKHLCLQSGQLISDDDQEAVKKFQSAVNLYEGDYLEETKTEEWVWSSRSYYRDLLVETMLKIDQFMQKKGLYDDLWKLYEDVLGVVKFEEELILGSVRTLLNSGHKGLARIKYEEAVSLFRENDLQLPVDLQKMGDKLKNIRIKNPYKVFEKNISYDDKEGAFVCDPQTFTLIYDLEKRRSKRKSPPLVLVHLNITYEENYFQENKPEAEPGKKVLKLLKKQLRSGDIVCRWRKKHFILLLVNIEEENINHVLERISSNFNDCYSNFESVNINYRYYEI